MFRMPLAELPMSAASPHFLLFCESAGVSEPCRWRFVLRSPDGTERLTADDFEPGTRGERLELLTVVRGLEALSRPSRVTVMTPSAYVREGIRYGMSEWRRNGWRWEAFGQMIPVKNCDLWQRLDRAMHYHEVECRHLRLDRPHQARPIPAKQTPSLRGARPRSSGQGGDIRAKVGRIVDRCRRWLAGRWPGLAPRATLSHGPSVGASV